MKKRSPDGWLRITDSKLRAFGETDFDKKIIRINKKKAKKSAKAGVLGELIDSIAHEEMHVKHPNMSERAVQGKTEAKVKKMSKKQKAKLYSRYS